MQAALGVLFNRASGHSRHLHLVQDRRVVRQEARTKIVSQGSWDSAPDFLLCTKESSSITCKHQRLKASDSSQESLSHIVRSTASIPTISFGLPSMNL